MSVRWKVRVFGIPTYQQSCNPSWVRVPADLFQNKEFGSLQDASKLLAVCIWTVAARSSDGSVPADLGWIKRQCSLGDSVDYRNVKDLISKGFLIDDVNTTKGCIPEAEGLGYVSH